MKKFLPSLLLLYFISNLSLAQGKCDISISFSPSFYGENARLLIDRGLGMHEPRIKRKPNKIYYSMGYQSSYVTVEVRYPKIDGSKPDHSMKFKVENKTATIIFHKNESSENLLGNYTAQNAIPFNELGEKEYRAFVKNEAVEYWKAHNDLKNSTADKTMIEIELVSKKTALLNKSLSFIIKNSNLPFSFWLFRTEIVGAKIINADSLSQLYSSLFSVSLRETYEGKLIEKQLKREKVRPQVQAPDFVAEDVEGRTINLKQFDGKFIILNFWASWCAPCIKEFPALREIEASYPKKDLEFVFVNLDKDVLKFQTALQKHDLSFGHHISRNQKMIEDYGISYIPRVFLISPEGQVIYSRHENSDDEDLTKLKELLDQLINDNG